MSRITYPCQYIREFFLTCTEVDDELKRILNGTGCRDVIAEKLRNRLKFLEERPKTLFQKRDWFEKPKNGFPAVIRITKPKNIRICFKFYCFRGKTYCVLMWPFVEQKKGTANSDSYSAHKRKALSIENSLEERFEKWLN